VDGEQGLGGFAVWLVRLSPERRVELVELGFHLR
jgi:hypothetical protein